MEALLYFSASKITALIHNKSKERSEAMKQQHENTDIYKEHDYPRRLDIPAGKVVALDELDENERLSIALSSYYLMYR